jgi:hypothetical protein
MIASRTRDDRIGAIARTSIAWFFTGSSRPIVPTTQASPRPSSTRAAARASGSGA